MKFAWCPLTRAVLCLLLAGMAGGPRFGSGIAGATDRRPLIDVQSDPVSLTLRTNKTQYARGEPIFLECELANMSEDLTCQFDFPIPDSPMPNRNSRFLHVAVARGTWPTPWTKYLKGGGGGGSFKSGDLPPGKTIRFHYHLNTYFDMTRDGEYNITAEVPVSLRGPKAPTGWVDIQARPIRVKVEGECPYPWKTPPRPAPLESPRQALRNATREVRR